MKHDATDHQPAAGADKRDWRRWALARRRALAEADVERSAERRVAAHLRAWEPWREARIALVYLAFGGELDPLRGGLLTDPSAGARTTAAAAAPIGPTLATTRTPPNGVDLEVRALLPHALERHPLGFLQPHADAPRVPLASIDVVLVPGLCFDERGVRLGYGRGYYDRLLQRLGAHAATVGVVHDALVVPRLPSAAHDVPVRFLVSASGLRSLRR